jgi:sugar phosphate isomerase/epimerase
MTRRTFLASAAAAFGAAPRSTMGLAATCFMTARQFKDALEFLEYSHSLGAGGIQTSLSPADPPSMARLRRRAEELGMYLEGMAELAHKDTGAFERLASAAKEAGAISIRTVAPGPRRYEAFATLDDWRRAAAESEAALRRALPIAERLKIPLAVENHRDRTLEEWLHLLGSVSSEFLGVCLDTGNNIALLDDPYEVVERLAPYAVSTHIKDVWVEESGDGFLLVEAPLGAGFLDLKRMVAAIRKARPKTPLTLEMITRDPTPVPCLGEEYWKTMASVDARRLARTLALVRAHKPPVPLPRPSRLAPSALLRLEEDNVKRSLHYAREQLPNRPTE